MNISGLTPVYRTPRREPFAWYRVRAAIAGILCGAAVATIIVYAVLMAEGWPK